MPLRALAIEPRFNGPERPASMLQGRRQNFVFVFLLHNGNRFLQCFHLRRDLGQCPIGFPELCILSLELGILCFKLCILRFDSSSWFLACCLRVSISPCCSWIALVNKGVMRP